MMLRSILRTAWRVTSFKEDGTIRRNLKIKIVVVILLGGERSREHVGRAEDHVPLHQVFQLADVARPVVGLKFLQELR